MIGQAEILLGTVIVVASATILLNIFQMYKAYKLCKATKGNPDEHG